jgi:hypothetical protein
VHSVGIQPAVPPGRPAVYLARLIAVPSPGPVKFVPAIRSDRSDRPDRPNRPDRPDRAAVPADRMPPIVPVSSVPPVLPFNRVPPVLPI